MRNGEFALLLLTLALLVLTPLAWVGAHSKWTQGDDLDGGDMLILYSAPVSTVALIVALVLWRFANRNAKPS
jgi:FtsH-binding integral membrane protein